MKISLCEGGHKLIAEDLKISYGHHPVLEIPRLPLCRGCVTSVIGPSGCGKSSLLLAMNRLIETIPHAKVQGRIFLDGVNILSPDIKVSDVRRRIGLVFQKPNPFPLSIFENIALALREHGLRDKKTLESRVQEALLAAGLWQEVKDKLKSSGLALSGGQQQRLCIARAIALKPEVLLLDEPCSALDPVSTAKIEALIQLLAQDYTLLVVTHNLAQAKRLSHKAAYLGMDNGMGRLIEFGESEEIFHRPQDSRTQDYISGRIG